MRILGYVAIVATVLFTTTSAEAQQRQRQTRLIQPTVATKMTTPKSFVLPRCTPGTVDGTQVFENVYLDGKCVGNPKMGIRVADFKLEVLCSIRSLRCIHVSQMREAQRRHYDRLAQFVKPTFAFKRCEQTDDSLTWRQEMATGADVHCNPGIHLMRSYDSVMEEACVLYVTKVLGCVPWKGTIQREYS